MVKSNKRLEGKEKPSIESVRFGITAIYGGATLQGMKRANPEPDEWLQQDETFSPCPNLINLSINP